MDKMTDSTYSKPADFDDYWAAVKAQLADAPASPEIEKIPMRETDFATLYGVRLSSIGPYRLFGYLSVPKGSGPFPAIYWPPKYQSVLEMIPQGTENRTRSRFVTFSLVGQGAAQLRPAIRGDVSRPVDRGNRIARRLRVQRHSR